MKGTKVLTLGAVGMSFHGFTGHRLYMSRYEPMSPDSACVSSCALFPHTKWPTVVSRSEAVGADLRNGEFSEKSFD